MDKVRCIYADNKQLVDYYEELIEKRQKEVSQTVEEYNPSDIMLVRTTDIFPKDRKMEPLINSKKISKKSFDDLKRCLVHRKVFEDIYSVPIEFEEQIEFYVLDYRSSVHFCENGLVQSHLQGNFTSRPFIIFEPLNEQLNNSDFRLFAAQDTFIKGNMTLSDKTIIMIPNDRIKDLLIQYPDLVNYQLIAYQGDEQEAVRILLYDLGYTPELIGTGHIIDSPSSQLVVNLNRKLASDMGCVSNTKHAFTEEYKNDVDNRISLYYIFERECVKFLVQELIDDPYKVKRILDDLETRKINDIDALYNLDHYEKDIIIDAINKFNSTIELMKQNNDLPYAFEVLNNSNLDVHNYYLNNMDLHISKK
jgi:hypothetical protein